MTEPDALIASDRIADADRPRLPRWAIALDWLALLAVLLASCIFVFGGGLREQIGPIRFSIRSWDRLLLQAVLLVVVRHALVRTPPMPRAILTQVTRTWRSEAWRAAWPAFLGTRLTVLIAGYLAVATIGAGPDKVRFSVSDHVLVDLPARWDAQWYANIIENGYMWNGNPQQQQSVVFFPAFPGAVRVVGQFLQEQWLWTGVLLSLLAFFCGLLWLYQLARDTLDAEHARVAVYALCAYPFSVYYSAPYTEGFYLFGSVGTFYYATRQRWLAASLLGSFVALCRPNGVFIAIPVAMIVLQRAYRERRLSSGAVAAMLSPALGLLIYCVFLYVSFGDPLAWTKGQLAWGRTYLGIWSGIKTLFLERYILIVYYGLYDYSTNQPYDLMHTAAAIFALVSIWPTIRRFGISYGAFTAINIIPPLVFGGMISIGRMTSVLFPAFLWLGAVVPARYATAWIAASCILQGLIAILFFTWRPIF